ncbi:sulfite exporter TauE/SafE family protein [Psychromonas sp. RZ22]|uniref:sulfite exporter TauE/SafE family protein n=1 Tax=Psychromonas algarum TaxID=2555643 RepID=UPI001067F40D|nr:sulfite exporter TauE/SafE family protein [Psychromonas sp. RZ22]TEW54648.1 sulfite exporter TauE/SafE family protein [Psychromonas sp. RZ22]
MDQIWYVLPIVMFAAVVRGYSGFGFAVIAVIGLNFFFDPQQSVAIILSLDLICSLNLWKQATKQANLPVLKKLIFGAFLGIPIGYCFLFFMPSEILKLLICFVVLALTILLLSSFRPFDAEKNNTKIAFGLASGAGTASASIGGPMIVYYMLSSNLSIISQRATMILFFIASEALSLITLAGGGLIDEKLPKALLILVIPTLLSVHYGQYLFNRKPPLSLKSFALPIMTIVSLLGIVNSSHALIAQ